ncbi:MAG: 23S rRNA (uracil(1939)-C(5))-methyltransferase RlmD [Bacillota bacterium]
MSELKKPPYSPGEVLELKIDDLNHKGEGVGKAAGFTLFVPGALPGEIVRAEVYRLRKNHGEAKQLLLKEQSSYRVEPPCSHFPQCGGCQIQHLAYEKQLSWKQKRVSESLKRIAGLENSADITASVLGMSEPWRYRNKARIHFAVTGNRVIAGFYQKQSHRIIDIKDCPVQHPTNAQMITVLREALRQYTGLKGKPGNKKSKPALPVEEAELRTSFSTGNCLVTLIAPINKAKKNPGRLKEEYKKLAELIGRIAKVPLAGISLYLPGKDSGKYLTLSGEPYLEETIPPFQYRLSPASFFQVNPEQAAILYDQAASMSGNPQTAYDLYCGTGNFSLYLGRKAEEVTGVDSKASAIKDARANAALNEMLNINFINARAEEIPELLSYGKQPKAIFINPPRRGCSPELLNAVLAAGPERIIYVSCNPATLARDLKYLKEQAFAACSVQPVDMFPHTTHIESAVLLQFAPYYFLPASK